MRKPHIWTADEIDQLRHRGWFYGLCRIDGHLCLCEILPGLGAAVQVTDGIRERQWKHALYDLWTLLQHPHWVIRDLWWYRP